MSFWSSPNESLYSCLNFFYNFQQLGLNKFWTRIYYFYFLVFSNGSLSSGGNSLANGWTLTFAECILTCSAWNVSFCFKAHLFYRISVELWITDATWRKCKCLHDVPLKISVFWNVRLIDFHMPHQRILGLQACW